MIVQPLAGKLPTPDMKASLVLLLFAVLLGGAAEPQQTRGLALVRTADGTEVELYEQSHALVIGMSRYEAGWRSLPGVETDVVAVRDVLQAHGFTVQVERNLTRDGFDRAVRAFIAAHGITPRNRLIIYFAGHGHTQPATDGRQLGFLVPVDAPSPLTDPTGFRARAVSMDQIEVYAREIESRHALMVFDSCFSGTLFDVSRALPGAVAANLEQPVRQFITSGTAGQEVPDTSEFRRQFVAGLEGEADLTRDGYISGTELGLFLEDKVASYTRQAQTPRFGKIRDGRLDKGDIIFLSPAAESASPVYTGASTPPDRPNQPDDRTHWEAIKDSQERSAFADFVRRFPQSQYRALADRRLADLDREDPVATAARWFDAVQARDIKTAYPLVADAVRKVMPESVVAATLQPPNVTVNSADRRVLYEERSADGNVALVIFVAGDQFQRLSLTREGTRWGAVSYRWQSRADAVPADPPPFYDAGLKFFELLNDQRRDEAQALMSPLLNPHFSREQFNAFATEYGKAGRPLSREVVYLEQDSPTTGFIVFRTGWPAGFSFERVSLVLDGNRWLMVGWWFTPAGTS